MSNTSDFIIEGGVLKQYKGNDSDVIIPDGVIEIKSEAFQRKSLSQKRQIILSLTMLTAALKRIERRKNLVFP